MQLAGSGARWGPGMQHVVERAPARRRTTALGPQARPSSAPGCSLPRALPGRPAARGRPEGGLTVLCVPPAGPQLELSLEDLRTKFKRHTITATLQVRTRGGWAVLQERRHGGSSAGNVSPPPRSFVCSLAASLGGQRWHLEALGLLFSTRAVPLCATHPFTLPSCHAASPGALQCTGNRRNEFNRTGRVVKGLEWEGGSISTAGGAPLPSLLPLAPCCPTVSIAASIRHATILPVEPVSACVLFSNRKEVKAWRPLRPAPAVFAGVRLRDVLLAAGLAEEDPEVQHIQASPHCLETQAFCIAGRAPGLPGAVCSCRLQSCL